MSLLWQTTFRWVFGLVVVEHRGGVWRALIQKLCTFVPIVKNPFSEMNIQSNPPLTNLQLELLKLFAIGVTDDEAKEIRRILAHFFMQKAVKEATKVWEEEGYTAEQLLREPS